MPSPPKITLEGLQRETILDSASLNASLRLVNALRDKYELLKYVKMYRDVYLCRRGDWISKFIRVSSPLMEQSKDRIHIPALDAHLLSSLPEGYGKYFASYFESDNIAAQIFKTHQLSDTYPQAKSIFYGKSSWDYFNLVTSVEWPVSLIFNQDILTKYQMLFRVLLMWHHLEYILTNMWTGSPLEDPLIPDVNNARHSILHFSSTFLNFSAIYTIHPLWSKLEETITTTTDINVIFKSHEESLNQLANGLLITTPEAFQIMMRIALDSFNFIDKFNEYKVSISSPIVTKEQRKQLAEPVMKQYRSFIKDVKALIQLLPEMTIKTGKKLYGDLANIININHPYT